MKKSVKRILITGGAGYIGQNLITFFLKENYKIHVIDNLLTSSPIQANLKKNIFFYKIDLTKEHKVKNFFRKKNFDLIIHLAAFSGVKEFNKNVSKFFNNNILATKNILNYGFSKTYTKLIFASSAAVYGKVTSQKISENNICNPVNFYGLSKLACEKLINNYFINKKNSYAILRYFNVVGSILDFKIKKKINSLFDIVSSKIKSKKYKININGKNLNTIDGTPERDFIHITDLCRIHKQIYNYLSMNNRIILNCGSGVRFSVLEVIRAFEKKIKKKFSISYKIVNLNETQTICSSIHLLTKLFKMNIKKRQINHLIKDYY